jgi:hypothetical protein
MAVSLPFSDTPREPRVGFELSVPHAMATVSKSPERDPTAYTETNYTRFSRERTGCPGSSSEFIYLLPNGAE